jgi:MoxR-like ATPase
MQAQMNFEGRFSAIGKTKGQKNDTEFRPVRGSASISPVDEANRMPERSWASLAPLMDDRRYIESEVAALKIRSHRDFRLAVTMNTDASVYELPGYIQSRLKPKIELVNPPWEMQVQIVRAKCPQVDQDLLRAVLLKLKDHEGKGIRDSTRDMLTLAQYAQTLRHEGADDALDRAVSQVLERAGD